MSMQHVLRLQWITRASLSAGKNFFPETSTIHLPTIGINACFLVIMTNKLINNLNIIETGSNPGVTNLDGVFRTSEQSRRERP